MRGETKYYVTEIGTFTGRRYKTDMPFTSRRAVNRLLAERTGMTYFERRRFMRTVDALGSNWYMPSRRFSIQHHEFTVVSNKEKDFWEQGRTSLMPRAQFKTFLDYRGARP